MNTLRPTEGLLVKLESGQWAQYRRITVSNGLTVLVAVELDQKTAASR